MMLNPHMAGPAKKHHTAKLSTSKIKPSTLDAAEMMMCTVVIEKEMKLKVMGGRATLATTTHDAHSTCPYGSGEEGA